jgi:hypothetical protein
MTSLMNETTPLLSADGVQPHVGIVKPPDEPMDDEYDSHHNNDEYDSHHRHHHHHPHRHFRRTRSDSHTSKVMELVADVKEELIEVLHEDLTTPIKPRDEGDHSYKLSAVALAVMVFYKVSGGPFGCEPTVKAAGPFFALLGFVLFPIFWCIPEALITAELGSAYPEPSGRMYLCWFYFTRFFPS